jgi:spermidine/putrescine transport system ATP-binding protein/putrescine transport system ATP-binding protein
MKLVLKRLQHEVGITFVVVTHDQEEAMSMADRIAVMSHGQVQQVDTPVDLYQRPANMFVADFIGSSNRFAGTRVFGGVEVPGIGYLPGESAVESANSSVVLVVRPEDMRLVDEADALLRGTVLDTVFYGGSSRVSLAVEGQTAPVIVALQGAASAERGATAYVAWQPEKAVVLESSA